MYITYHWASWSDRPLIMGAVQEEFSLAQSIKILSMAVLEEFTVCDRLYVCSRELICCL
jgi:hypothetical protein